MFSLHQYSKTLVAGFIAFFCLFISTCSSAVLSSNEAKCATSTISHNEASNALRDIACSGALEYSNKMLHSSFVLFLVLFLITLAVGVMMYLLERKTY